MTSAPSAIVDAYQQWLVARAKANTIEEDDVLSAFCDTVMEPLERLVVDTPARTLQELAVKVRMFEELQGKPIRAEIDALIRGEAWKS